MSASDHRPILVLGQFRGPTSIAKLHDDAIAGVRKLRSLEKRWSRWCDDEAIAEVALHLELEHGGAAVP